MTSHMEGLDIFLNSKGSFILKDEGFDILDTDNWNLDDDKFLESIRYGDRLDLDDTELMEDPHVTDSPPTEIISVESPPEIISYSLSEGGLSPCSASSTASSSSPAHSQSGQFDDQNVKVVQLVGILPAGCKTFQIVQQDEDGTISGEEIMEVTSTGSPGTHHSYQELKLSEEERRLLIKEGVNLPTHYPLTKFEERELKRIRRKIRNKISAQDSRKRKKEFLDTLQQRVQEVEEEKSLLGRKVRSLEIANSKLVAQVKRLQVMMANATKAASSSLGNQNAGNGQGGHNNNNVVPAATTLLVLMLSLAIVVLPTMQGRRQASTTASIENALMKGFADSTPNTSIIGRSRTMLGLDHSSEEIECDWTMVDVEEPLAKIPRFSFQQPVGMGNVVPTAAQRCHGQMNTVKSQGAGALRKRPFSVSGLNALVDEVD